MANKKGWSGDRHRKRNAVKLKIYMHAWPNLAQFLIKCRSDFFADLLVKY